MISPGSSRYSLNDMVHNHYLEEAKKKTQEIGRNSKPSVIPFARSTSTTNGRKPKPRINNQRSRNWNASKSSCVITKTVPIAEHSRNSRNFFDSKHFVCSTCQKCVFNANHDHCVTKFLNKVNSCAKVPSNKATNRNKPVEQISVPKKQERQIPTGHRFSIKKTFVVHEKTTSPRSCLRWKQKGRIFKTVGLRWVPTRKIFTSSTTKVDSEPTNSLNEDVTNQYECEQTLDISAGTLNLSAGTSFNPKKEGLRSSSKLVPKVVPPAEKIATSQQELELLFSPMYEEYFNAGNPSVSKSSTLSDNLQQHDTQPITNIHPTLEPIIPPLKNNAEDNNYDSGLSKLELGSGLLPKPSQLGIYRVDPGQVKLGFAAVLAVLVTGASQSRQHESRKPPTKSLLDVGSRRISIVTVNTKEYHSDVLAVITRIMRRTL
ncbi:hypothetical protein Tco_0616036 [Tanacetum coccineum]